MLRFFITGCLHRYINDVHVNKHVLSALLLLVLRTPTEDPKMGGGKYSFAFPVVLILLVFVNFVIIENK